MIGTVCVRKGMSQLEMVPSDEGINPSLPYEKQTFNKWHFLICLRHYQICAQQLRSITGLSIPVFWT